MKNPNMTDEEINDLDRLNHFGYLADDLIVLMQKHDCLIDDIVFVCGYLKRQVKRIKTPGSVPE